MIYVENTAKELGIERLNPRFPRLETKADLQNLSSSTA